MDPNRTRIAALSASIACLLLFTGCALPQRKVKILDVTEEGSSAITYLGADERAVLTVDRADSASMPRRD